MVNLPWDILPYILVRMPVKSIARFRCVNKAWCNLLKNPEFLKTQYKHAVEMNRFSIMFHNQNDIYTFSYDPSSSTCERSGHIKYPVESLDVGIEFFGCCNGLVLLRHINKFMSPALTLWNPSTNECKKLPDPPTWLEEHRRGFVEYGFGYDHQIEDFKVVHIALDYKNKCCEAQVYTLRSNSWRRLEDIELMLFDTCDIPDMGRLPVNGALYWNALIGGDIRAERILRFDFEKEEFDRIPRPDEVNDDHEPHLCALGGSLWLLVNDYGDSGCILELWELKDDGVKKSWIHPFTINVYKYDGMDELIPLQFLENGNILFGVHSEHTCLRFVLYDLKHETIRILKAYEDMATSSFPTSVYVESLISLGTGTYLGQVQRDEVDNYDSEEEEDEEEVDSDDSEEEEEEVDNDDGGTGVGTSNCNDDNQEKDTLRKNEEKLDNLRFCALICSGEFISLVAMVCTYLSNWDVILAKRHVRYSYYFGNSLLFLLRQLAVSETCIAV